MSAISFTFDIWQGVNLLFQGLEDQKI